MLDTDFIFKELSKLEVDKASAVAPGLYSLGEMMVIAAEFDEYKTLLSPGHEIRMHYLDGKQYDGEDIEFMEEALAAKGIESIRKERCPGETHGEFLHVWAFKPARNKNIEQLRQILREAARHKNKHMEKSL